jgi:hypothetical protein
MTGNGTNGWGNTNFNGTSQYVNNMSIGCYINATGSTQGCMMGVDSTNGTKTQLQLVTSTNTFIGGISVRSIINPSVTLTGRTGFYAVSKTGVTTNNILHQNGVSLTATTSNGEPE